MTIKPAPKPLKLDPEAIRLLLVPFAKTKSSAKKIGKALGIKGEELTDFKDALQHITSEYNSLVRHTKIGLPDAPELSLNDLLAHLKDMDVHNDGYEVAFNVVNACLDGEFPKTVGKCDHEKFRWATIMFITAVLYEDSEFKGDRSNLH